MMKRGFLLRTVTFIALAMFVANGLNAQVANADYEEYDANLTAPTNIDYVTLRASGTTTMGYYAEPDPVYHPNYTAVGTWALTAGFVWDWTIAPVMATAKPGAANYVEIAYTATGTYNVTVAEHAPVLWGGCVDASPTEMVINVIDPPSATASIAPAGWQVIAANSSYQICDDQAGETVTVTFTEDVPDNLAAFAFQVTEQIDLINGAGAVLSTSQAETVIQNFPLAGKLNTGNVGTLTAAAFNAATPTFTYTFTSDDLDVLQNAGVDARTRYTYRVRRAGAAVSTDDDFLSNISQKSDYLLGAGNENYYAFTNNAVSFIVNPTPATGPIYYIPNDYAY